MSLQPFSSNSSSGQSAPSGTQLAGPGQPDSSRMGKQDWKLLAVTQERFGVIWYRSKWNGKIKMIYTFYLKRLRSALRFLWHIQESYVFIQLKGKQKKTHLRLMNGNHLRVDNVSILDAWAVSRAVLGTLGAVRINDIFAWTSCNENVHHFNKKNGKKARPIAIESRSAIMSSTSICGTRFPCNYPCSIVQFSFGSTN